MTVTHSLLRQELGDFNSIVCVKAILIGAEEALGEKAAAIALIAAGRQRGKNIANELGLVDKGNSLSLEEVGQYANSAFGKDGTRLCIIDKVEQDGEVYRVYTKETICSTGEASGSERVCNYTLGAIQGFLEAFLGKRLRGKQTESVLRGGTHDVLEYIILA